MSKKHFIALANALKDTKAPWSTVQEVARVCAQNAKEGFRFSTFYAACGYSQDENGTWVMDTPNSAQ